MRAVVTVPAVSRSWNFPRSYSTPWSTITGAMMRRLYWGAEQMSGGRINIIDSTTHRVLAASMRKKLTHFKRNSRVLHMSWSNAAHMACVSVSRCGD